jgi:hypothetical protein
MPAVIQHLVRSGLVLTGLLLIGVGVGNVLAGRSKFEQYRELLSATAPVAPVDSAALFPSPSEREERHALARAKLAFYQLLMTAGQLLSALGCGLLAVGVVRVWLRTPPLRVDSSPAN